MRGTPISSLSSTSNPRGTPAHAGNTKGCCRGYVHIQDHPRTRGEHEEVCFCGISGTGSLPHTRGTPSLRYSMSFGFGITPAHAGNTASTGVSGALTEDHPRTRGEHRPPLLLSMSATGSPPHTRGTRIRAIIDDTKLRITPAHAGNTSAA